MTRPHGSWLVAFPGVIATLFVRSILLWLVVPAACLAWPVVGRRRRAQGVTLGQYLGWVDANLIAGLQRTAVRPLVRDPALWVSWENMADVTHRIRWSDPM